MRIIEANHAHHPKLTNLLNQRNYSYTVFDGINTYTYDYGLCGRTIAPHHV